MRMALVGIGAAVAIVVIIIGVTLTVQSESVVETEDTVDETSYLTNETKAEENIDPEIQEKLEEIEKINLENEYSPKPREWLTSGPFQIDRSQYVLGEKIFLRTGGLGYFEKGQVVFLRPLNQTHYSVYISIPFDGTKSQDFNYYIDPAPSKARGICSAEDITGNWTVVFRGTDYPNIKFEIIDQILPGEEDKYSKAVC